MPNQRVLIILPFGKYRNCEQPVKTYIELRNAGEWAEIWRKSTDHVQGHRQCSMTRWQQDVSERRMEETVWTLKQWKKLLAVVGPIVYGVCILLWVYGSMEKAGCKVSGSTESFVHWRRLLTEDSKAVIGRSDWYVVIVLIWAFSNTRKPSKRIVDERYD